MIRVVKITALWCCGCLIMDKVWKDIIAEKKIETINLDYDFNYDEVQKYQPGKVLPVFIFYKDDIEYKRVIGEEKKELLQVVKELGL